MWKINYTFLPIKAHYFFFHGALSPVWPFVNVFGKQMGVSEVVMGSISAILPLLFLVAKPTFGLIADYFRNQRRALFMGLIASGSAFYVLLYFIPQPDSISRRWSEGNLKMGQVDCDIPQCEQWNISASVDRCTHGNITEASCSWSCTHNETASGISTLLYEHYSDGSVQLRPLCLLANDTLPCEANCNLTCSLAETDSRWECLYGTSRFWGFVILMSLGSIAFNVANSISDAICFDMLGEKGEMAYGRQRMWGTVGYGVTVFITGWLIDWWSGPGAIIKDYTPAFCLVFILTCVDMFWCTKLKLPTIPTSKNILRDVGKLIRHRHIAIFITFATLSGLVDSFIFYFRFWYLEDLATASGNMGHIKILEGCIVAAETMVGEVLFFFISGKIITKIGFGNSLTLCFLCYAIRLGLISLVSNPWWVVPIDIFMQGPTYALGYTTIVAYASAVSPPGTSATMQGIVAGMDDGFGYAVGGLLGGVLYRWIGGSRSFQVMSAIAASCSIIHYGLYKCYLKKKMVKVEVNDKSQDYKLPKEAIKATETAAVNDQPNEDSLKNGSVTL